MYAKHHTRGIILSSKADGDYDRVAYIFTQDFGLLRAKAQGVRRLGSKIASGVQDFSHGEYSLVHGKSGWRLVSARAEGNIFEDLRGEKAKLEVVAKLFLLIKKMMGEEEPNNELFLVVINFIGMVRSVDLYTLPGLECLVILKVLYHLGYMNNDPEFSLPLASVVISEEEVKRVLPKRSFLISVINDALRASHL